MMNKCFYPLKVNALLLLLRFVFFFFFKKSYLFPKLLEHTCFLFSSKDWSGLVVVACRQVAGDHVVMTWKLDLGGSRRGLNYLIPVGECCEEGGSFLSPVEYRNCNSHTLPPHPPSPPPPAPGTLPSLSPEWRYHHWPLT
jgi:hypothetical protein